MGRGDPSHLPGEVVGVALRRPRRAGPTAASTWASALDRYRRAVARYSESLRTMPERQLRSDLTDLAGPLEAVLEDFEDAAAQRAGYDEAGAAAVLGCVHRAATLCSHATEAAQMANQAAWRADADDVARCLDTVRVLVKKIDELGDEVRPRR